MNHVIIGTAGHVDHGKTLLIKALTGIDTDRLQEEKKLDSQTVSPTLYSCLLESITTRQHNGCQQPLHHPSCSSRSCDQPQPCEPRSSPYA